MINKIIIIVIVIISLYIIYSPIKDNKEKYDNISQSLITNWDDNVCLTLNCVYNDEPIEITSCKVNAAEIYEQAILDRRISERDYPMYEMFEEKNPLNKLK